MPIYTVRRDDNELRLVICPACSNRDNPWIDVEKTDEIIPYKSESYFMHLMRCNRCHSYFSFDKEDGIRDITKEWNDEKCEIRPSYVDMQYNGKDQHGHSYYIVFKSKPPTISKDEYNRLMGYEQDKDGNYIVCDEEEDFRKFLKAMPSINFLIRYRDIINNLDFERMDYLEKSDIRFFERKKDVEKTEIKRNVENAIQELRLEE